MIAKRKDEQADRKDGATHVAFYIRVSSDKQAKKQDGSLDTQLDLLNEFVEKKVAKGENWMVSERFVEGESEGQRRGKSAKDTNRATFQRMLAMARARLIDVIVATRMDRISRSVVDFLLLVQELDKYGVKVVSLREDIDLTTPMGRFHTTLMMTLAQYERETIAARVKEKVDWRAQRGLPIGPAPMGYRMKDKMFVIDEPYAKHIRECDRLYLELQSTDAVAREFSRLGFRTPHGRPYSVQQICTILRNPRYAAKQPHEGELLDAQWKPIRAWETHERIQKILDRNNERKHSPARQSAEYVYLLQGLLRCGTCGHMMTPLSGTGRNGRSYPYYCCSNAEKFSGTVCPCKYVPAQAAEGAVIEFMKKLVLKPDIVEAFAKRANDSTSGTRSRIKADHDRVRQQLATVRTKIGHFLDAIGEGGKDAMASIKARLRELEREREELEESEARLRAEHEAETSQEIIVQHQIESLKLFNQIISKNEDQPDRLKSLIPRFVEYVIWSTLEKGEGTIEVGLYGAPVALAPDAVWGERKSDSKLEAVVSSETRGWYPRQDSNLRPSV